MKKAKQYTGMFLAAAGIAAAVSCSGIKNTALRAQLEKSNCNQQNVYTYTVADMPRPIHEIIIDTALLSKFSFKSLNMAHAIGVLDDLGRYADAQKKYRMQPSAESRLHLLELSQKIANRINISSLEVSAVSSEMDCEEERASQIANYLSGKQDALESKLTVGAIVVGATGAISTGALLNSGNSGDYIGVGTGVAEATLGLLILLNKSGTEFHHKRNALKEIWKGQATSSIFPPSVWYYLNYKNPAQQGAGSLRELLIEKWISFGQVAHNPSKKQLKKTQLYFGNGGKYSAGQLNNRADMYDQLESNINLMKQDLKGLFTELEQLHY
ncbi:hypothetical protein [Niabella drilacis]|uniref:Lipoprotein n=1 Tax=Niabella drilacis (strain DSM 25811 / CCM 8410 / CCUG 62505 / LMG 26954 / E90) TaxID=1285928 RepID=A0A1G6KQG6_NIADE|nr:hypothetical protein [Niabella drilacis]SDC33352.1 hypothetical protein SAMN04487894_10267 [Niabella drilacis]